MGWKAIRDHYDIQHIVHVRDGKILIGSAYISDIIIIDPIRGIEKRYEPGSGWSKNANLSRYQEEIEADPAKLLELAAQQDVFARSIRIFTFDYAIVSECLCEELGWPNVTHDGRLMYENRFSTNRDEVVGWAVANARAWAARAAEYAQECQGTLIAAVDRAEAAERALTALLEREFPPKGKS